MTQRRGGGDQPRHCVSHGSQEIRSLARFLPALAPEAPIIFIEVDSIKDKKIGDLGETMRKTSFTDAGTYS